MTILKLPSRHYGITRLSFYAMNHTSTFGKGFLTAELALQPSRAETASEAVAPNEGTLVSSLTMDLALLLHPPSYKYDLAPWTLIFGSSHQRKMLTQFVLDFKWIPVLTTCGVWTRSPSLPPSPRLSIAASVIPWNQRTCCYPRAIFR
jgi:hypothetical protein